MGPCSCERVFGQYSHSIWYRWLAPANGNATLSTAGSTFDTLLAVYTGSQVDQLQSIASDEDSAGFLTSQTRFPVTAGGEYQIAIDGFNGATGKTVLTWSIEVTPDLVPLIIQQPVDQAVKLGDAAGFEVKADGSGWRYQWLFNEQPIVGATSSRLVLTNVQISDIGAYRAWVINASGTKSNRSERAHLEGYDVTEGEVASVAVGQDKPEDLTATGPSAQRAGFGWKAIPPAGLSLKSGYSISQWADNRYDTTQLFENQSAAEISRNSRWFALKAEAAGICTLSTEGRPIPTILEVFRSGVRDFTRLAWDKTSAPDARSRLRFEANPDDDYFVRVAAAAEPGLFKLTRRLELPQRYEQWERASESAMRFRLQIPRDVTFQVDESVDLRQWTPLISTNAPLGLFELRVRQEPAPSQRFYRALLLLPSGSGEFNGNIDGQ